MRVLLGLGLVLALACSAGSAAGPAGAGGAGGDAGASAGQGGGAGAGGAAQCSTGQGTCNIISSNEPQYPIWLEDCAAIADATTPAICGASVPAGCVESHFTTQFEGQTEVRTVWCCPECHRLSWDSTQGTDGECGPVFPYADYEAACDYEPGTTNYVNWGDPWICPSGVPNPGSGCGRITSEPEQPGHPHCELKQDPSCIEPAQGFDVFCCPN